MKKLSLLLLGAALCLPALSQGVPSAEVMVRALVKPEPPKAGPATRGLRNLTVEAVPPKPSLSLLIQFDFDSARVKPESQELLANLSQALQSQELRESKFAVEGHTDAKGAAEYNLKLSAQRAEAVRSFLRSRGVVDERLLASGKGSTELANAADPYAAENRRVRIVNLD